MARITRARCIALAILIALVAPAGFGAGPAHAAVVVREGCRGPSNAVAVADQLLANHYQLAGHPVVTLPANPAWNEDPLNSRNWEFNYHSLRFVLALTDAWTSTGNTRYRDRALFLLSDWYRDNPRSAPRDPMAWNDHSTAWRAMVYVCAAEVLPASSWLTSAIKLHGTVLADPDFYRWDGGNHALNQDIGLLEVGCHLRRSDWMSLATRRLTRLVGRSVDVSGATNEQAVGYELYNWSRYTYARTRFTECGQTLGSGFDRVDAMPVFLGHATLPNGRYAPIGDSQSSGARAITGTLAEFAATKGLSGPRPTGTDRLYGAGYAFVRTGWGATRPYEDEVMATVRFGPARQFHGHYDGTSVTLYGYGRQLLADSGMYTIESGKWRNYFVGRSAHNLLTVDGATFRPTAGTSLRWKRSSTTMYEVALASSPYVGVTTTRRVTFSRSLGYLLVDDRASSTVRRTFRQLWHLSESTAPVLAGSRVYTTATRGNVVIAQVITPAATRIIKGATAPIQGWISYKHGQKLAAPVVEARRSGTTTRFLTLLVPFASTRPRVSVSNVTLGSNGIYALTVTVGTRSERVVAGNESSRITPLP